MKEYHKVGIFTSHARDILFTMISSLSGTLALLDERSWTVVVGGVGYEVYTPTPTHLAHKEGDSVDVFIYTHVKEDQLTLFGFETREEKTLFVKLITVSGVGPKSALGILSAHSPSSLVRAVEQGDTATLSRSPGVGRRTAEKIILELKGKLSFLNLSPETDQLSEVRLALEALGYGHKDIDKALQGMEQDGKSVGEMVKTALLRLR